MKKRIAVVIFLLLSLAASAQAPFSGQAEISVITCGPYQGEVYSAFGHSAIRVRDPSTGEDLAFNYGTFTFDPAFYINFPRGDLFYKLGVYPYDRFRDAYIAQNRYVHEQVLDLTDEQKQKVRTYLHRNALPENATYRYDYFYNNCATKVRDVFVVLFGDSIRFDGSYIKTDYTIRELTDSYLAEQPWGDLGIDICLGLPMDKKLAPFEYMFLPDYIESGFDHAKLNGRRIVKRKNIVYKSSPEPASFSLLHPWIVFNLFLLGAILLCYYDWKKKKLTKWFDAVLFSVVGLAGVLLVLLWTATDHQAAAKNLNLLWAVPFHVVAAVLLFSPRFYTFVAGYFMITGILSWFTLLLWFFLPQELNVFLIPFNIVLGIRGYTISRLLVPGKLVRS